MVGRFQRLQVAVLVSCITFAGTRSAIAEVMAVRNPQNLPAELQVERIPLGIVNDYKPCVVKLDSRELLVVAFHQYQLEGEERGKIREDNILFRSTDGGRTWTSRETLPVVGREPYFSSTRGGTLFLTEHLLKRDVRNDLDYVHSYVHRSADRGKTWETTRILSSDVPGAVDKAWVHTSRNVYELQDGTLILGVSAKGGGDVLWKSVDNGRTWNRKTVCRFTDVDTRKLWWPFYAETLFYQASNGDLLTLFRVDPKQFPPLPGSPIPQAKNDQSERLIVFRSVDGGAHWTRDPELGSYYGEMYPAILELNDKRLLLTFTVRAERPPLGVHAVLGRATSTGFEFDFESDRIVIDEKTPEDQGSGGGFGPTVQLEDGTLVTAYSFRDGNGQTHLEIARWRLP